MLTQSRIEAAMIFALLTMMVLSTTVCVNAMIMLDGHNLILNAIK